MLGRLRERFVADLPPELHARYEQAEASVAEEAARPLAGQVFLARQLPDYWQRFERYQREDAEARLAEAAKPGWIRRLFGQS